jgi:hypothetical protein
MAFLRAANDYYQNLRFAERESYGRKVSKVERLESSNKQRRPFQE